MQTEWNELMSGTGKIYHDGSLVHDDLECDPIQQMLKLKLNC